MNVLSIGSGGPTIVEDREDVRAWIARLLGEGPIAYIDVSRVLPSGEEERAGSLSGSGGQDASGAIGAGDYAANLARLMQDEADNFGGPQHFMCYAFRDPNDTRFSLFAGKYQRRARFTFQGHGTPEPPTRDQVNEKIEQVFLGVSLHHTQKMSEITIAALSRMRDVDDREKNRQARRIEFLEEREDRRQKILIEMQEQGRQKEIELLKAKREDRMHEGVYKMLSMAAPAMMSKILPAGSTGPALQGSKLQEFFEELSPGQIKKIIATAGFNEGQLLAFQALHEQFSKGETPALGTPLVKELISQLTSEQTLAIEAVLRPEQVKLLGEIGEAYMRAIIEEQAVEKGIDPEEAHKAAVELSKDSQT
jgi:hypothetical protein